MSSLDTFSYKHWQVHTKQKEHKYKWYIDRHTLYFMLREETKIDNVMETWRNKQHTQDVIFPALTKLTGICMSTLYPSGSKWVHPIVIVRNLYKSQNIDKIPGLYDWVKTVSKTLLKTEITMDDILGEEEKILRPPSLIIKNLYSTSNLRSPDINVSSTLNSDSKPVLTQSEIKETSYIPTVIRDIVSDIGNFFKSPVIELLQIQPVSLQKKEVVSDLQTGKPVFDTLMYN